MIKRSRGQIRLVGRQSGSLTWSSWESWSRRQLRDFDFFHQYYLQFAIFVLRLLERHQCIISVRRRMDISIQVLVHMGDQKACPKDERVNTFGGTSQQQTPKKAAQLPVRQRKTCLIRLNQWHLAACNRAIATRQAKCLSVE